VSEWVSDKCNAGKGTEFNIPGGNSEVLKPGKEVPDNWLTLIMTSLSEIWRNPECSLLCCLSTEYCLWHHHLYSGSDNETSTQKVYSYFLL